MQQKILLFYSFSSFLNYYKINKKGGGEGGEGISSSHLNNISIKWAFLWTVYWIIRNNCNKFSCKFYIPSS